MIRITIKRNAEHVTGPRTIVKEFVDALGASNWLLNDSYFEQDYTVSALWERVEPPWQIGDVVQVLDLGMLQSPSTLVRGQAKWSSVENSFSYADTDVDKQVAAGRAVVVIRGGKVMPA